MRRRMRGLPRRMATRCYWIIVFWGLQQRSRWSCPTQLWPLQWLPSGSGRWLLICGLILASSEAGIVVRIGTVSSRMPQLQCTWRPLAVRVTEYWTVCQDSSGIRAFTMPLVRLTSITLDQVPTDREKIIATLLKYCHTDTLCCRADEGSKLAGEWLSLVCWLALAILYSKSILYSSFN